ncbi:MAG TPA: glycosyltransferase, partial [bacterium]|nr:glycosyltransferase [bacterium]
AKGGGTGCALRAFYIAGAFKKRGHQARFVAPIPSLPLWFDMALSTFYYFLVSLLTRSDASIVIKPYPMAVPALWLQRLKGAKVVIDVDDLDYDYSQGWFRSFHLWLQKPWPSWADWVTYHNPRLKQPLGDIFKVPSSKLVQLPQGVDTSLFKPGPSDPSGLPEAVGKLRESKGPLLVFTAHLNVACDLEPVLESFKKILASLPQARLLVAGGGPDENRFKSLARDLGLADSTTFTGMISPAQVASCLGLADAALVYYRDSPVNRHRSSMKLREALACGLKVVATRVGEAALLKSVLYLCDPNPAAFAREVLKALKSKKSSKGAALLVKKWDWTNCVKDLETKIYHRQDAKFFGTAPKERGPRKTT